MIDLFLKNYDGIVKAFWETNYMMGISMVTVFVISMPLGILLFSLKCTSQCPLLNICIYINTCQ